MLCGSFREGVTRQVSLDDIDKKGFEEVLDLWCGKVDRAEKELREVIVMASLADRLQIADFVAALEDSILADLGAGDCAGLISSQGHGLRRVEEAAWGGWGRSDVSRRCQRRRGSRIWTRRRWGGFWRRKFFRIRARNFLFLHGQKPVF